LCPLTIALRPGSLIAAATPVAAAAASHRGHVVERGLRAIAEMGGEDGEQAAHLLAMAFGTDHIVRVLMADKELKF